MEVVYVLTNPAMPGLVKIGFTTQDDTNTRVAQLYTTGVPVPFSLEFACRVPNGAEVERAFHVAFAPNRVNPRREFFKIEPEQAIAILRLLHVQDATEEIAQQPVPTDQQSLEAAAQLRARRPNLNFEEMGIPVGSELRSIHREATATVVSAKVVSYLGEEQSLTAATRSVLNVDYSVAPSPHWTYQGRLLREIYNETYGTDG
jgi:hypothetical protein